MMMSLPLLGTLRGLVGFWKGDRLRLFHSHPESIAAARRRFQAGTERIVFSTAPTSSLSVNVAEFLGNQAFGGAGGSSDDPGGGAGNGGYGEGGAILIGLFGSVGSTLTVNSGTFSGNQAVGGDGFAAGTSPSIVTGLGGMGLGGGVYSGAKSTSIGSARSPATRPSGAPRARRRVQCRIRARPGRGR